MCGDNKFCDEELRCSKYGKITGLSQSDVIIKHFYCQYSFRENGDSLYNRIDRSDEGITNTLDVSDNTLIDYSYLMPCNNSHGEPGVSCHVLSTDKSDPVLWCAPSYVWCRSDGQASCVTSEDGTRTSTSDGILCRNKTFWETKEPSLFNYRGLMSGLGARCNGSLMHHIIPWYKFYNGVPASWIKQNCEDKSDQVFSSGEPCHNRTYYISIHNKEWCSKLWVKMENEPICTNTSAWLKNTIIDQSRLDDPHFCQDSCAKPGLNCIACENEKYFKCSRSDYCIHPDLKCDGHPQCPDNEDEDFEMCKTEYFYKKVVAPFASFKCNSATYPNIYTIATACNKITECVNGTDEEFCNNDASTTSILVGLMFGVLGLFIGLKIPHLIEYHKKTKEQENKRNTNEESLFDEIIQKMKENPYDKLNNRKINTYLLYILNSKETAIIKEIYIQFYDCLSAVFLNNEAEIFFYLKANMHPEVTKDIVEHKFRGLKTKIIYFIEKIIGRNKITKLLDKITTTPSLRMSLSALRALVSMMVHFLDIVKDVTLAGSLLVITGGLTAITEFPTNFGSAVVLCWMGTIIVPILASSLNLALTQPFLVFTSTRLRAMRGGRMVAALGCLLLSPLNTVVLKTNLEITEQRAIEAARDQSDSTCNLLQDCEVIEEKLLEYLQIELG